MLVSVRERTREIGLRMALGARQRDITVQFLIEAVLLTTIGGTIGIAARHRRRRCWPTRSRRSRRSSPGGRWSWPSPSRPAVGVFFGVSPARRAGRLDPVVALRTE